METYIICSLLGAVLCGWGYWLGRRHGYRQGEDDTYAKCGHKRSYRVVPVEEVNGVLREKKR